MALTQSICEVCRQTSAVDKGLIVKHNDKHGNVCYGSLRPASDINPFKKSKKKLNLNLEPFMDDTEEENPEMYNPHIAQKIRGDMAEAKSVKVKDRLLAKKIVEGRLDGEDYDDFMASLAKKLED